MKLYNLTGVHAQVQKFFSYNPTMVDDIDILSEKKISEIKAGEDRVYLRFRGHDLCTIMKFDNGWYYYDVAMVHAPTGLHFGSDKGNYLAFSLRDAVIEAVKEMI